MSSRPDASTLDIRLALDRSEPLARLAQRLRDSRARFECIAPLLSPPLRAQVQPGPVDEQEWALLTTSGAVAAKLRQLVPALQDRLLGAGWPPIAVKVRVLGRG